MHTNKTMRRLKRLGLHDIRNGRLWLLNPKALERKADYYDTPPRKVPLLQLSIRIQDLRAFRVWMSCR